MTKYERLAAIMREAQELVREIKYDVNAFRQRDPAARSNLEILLLYSGLILSP